MVKANIDSSKIRQSLQKHDKHDKFYYLDGAYPTPSCGLIQLHRVPIAVFMYSKCKTVGEMKSCISNFEDSKLNKEYNHVINRHVINVTEAECMFPYFYNKLFMRVL